jgi:hypothetical protein
VFETVVVVDVDRYTNSLIFATNAPASLEAFRGAAGIGRRRSGRAGDGGPGARDRRHPGRFDRRPDTDRRPRPIEWIIDQIIVDEALREEP